VYFPPCRVAPDGRVFLKLVAPNLFLPNPELIKSFYGTDRVDERAGSTRYDIKILKNRAWMQVDPKSYQDFVKDWLIILDKQLSYVIFVIRNP
jgi:hypothetical protein